MVYPVGCKSLLDNVALLCYNNGMNKLQNKKSRKVSLLIKITGVSSLFLFVAVAALAVYGVIEIRIISTDVGLPS
jgi:hypothetical protein